jgi:predicted nucleic acid-binding protein
MIVVADTGPLIALAKIKSLHLLHELYQQIITGPVVYTEAVTAGQAMNAGDAADLNEAYQQGILTVRTPSAISLPYPDFLHAGEAESIRLAIDLPSDWLLADDLDARQIATQNFVAAGVSTGIKGTLGIIVTAAMARIISVEQATDMVKTLQNRPDIWLSPALCKTVVKSLHSLN